MSIINLNDTQTNISSALNSCYSAWLAGQLLKNISQVVLFVPNTKVAELIRHDFKVLNSDSECFVLEPFDESPTSGLQTSPRTLHGRASFLWNSQNTTGLFIIPASGLIYKTLPPDVFKKHCLVIHKGETFNLNKLKEYAAIAGYLTAPVVEDSGTYSSRGDVFDIYSPSYEKPLRLEFFGDTVESIRFFDVDTQRSLQELEKVSLSPAREFVLTRESISLASKNIKKTCDDNDIPKDARDKLVQPLLAGALPPGIEFWGPLFNEYTASVLDFFDSDVLAFKFSEGDFITAYGNALDIEKNLYQKNKGQHLAIPPLDSFLFEFKKHIFPRKSLVWERIHIDAKSTDLALSDLNDFQAVVRASREAKKDFLIPAAEKIHSYQKEGFKVVVFAGSQTQAQRLSYLFETHQILNQLLNEQTKLRVDSDRSVVSISSDYISQSFKSHTEKLIFLRDEDIFGERKQHIHRTPKKLNETRVRQKAFAELQPEDFIVHILHGIGVYEGLKKLSLQGIENEFIQLRYKDGDKLYLPVYRVGQIQKYTGPGSSTLIDKLGTNTWQKAKVKVKNSLKDLANELLQLYAKRMSTPGFEFSKPDDSFREFEATFPYDETPDQARAIQEVIDDMTKPRPMDRLVCGDVGFGKTEVAMRAAYKAAQDGKQTVVLVPTTVLAFQHNQTFKKRFADTAVRIEMLSRFVPPAQSKKILADLAAGKIDVIIGTHRLLSKDLFLKDLGLLIVDEEQRFGVTHKEKIKKFKAQVDVLSMSATPIPRTLNMGLMGVRDLSLISTPPVERVSTRTFISRRNPDVIKKAIDNEMQRGGQVFVIHNRVQSIQSFADEIRSICPNVRLAVAHGQMEESALEKTMLDFYNHEFDVLISTTIIESGLDIPLANTMLIDRADTFGLSQLYQLRGRIGRSKERAYAHLLLPEHGIIDPVAQERLRIIQKYSDLGSGFQIAHHDLELRGSGNILGDDQSGHISAVGYELYMELLQQVLAETKGEPHVEELEPDINLKIQALIPDEYIADIRIRLMYYRMLSEIKDDTDLDRIEEELIDRFGEIPESVSNLFGVMLIRLQCKEMGIRDISQGPKNLSLAFTNNTKADPMKMVKLVSKDIDKYQLTPDQRLIVKLGQISWQSILTELQKLKALI